MSNKKLSHADFIALCETKGIIVEKITRTRVYVLPMPEAVKVEKVEKHKSCFLPNYCLIGNLGEAKIDAEWRDGSTGRSLEEYIKQNTKIGCIKVIRANTGLGLKESKDIADASMGEWKRLFGVEERSE